MKLNHPRTCLGGRVGVNLALAGSAILHAVHNVKLDQMQHLTVAHAHVLEEGVDGGSRSAKP
jgi:hypothetical protein